MALSDRDPDADSRLVLTAPHAGGVLSHQAHVGAGGVLPQPLHGLVPDQRSEKRLRGIVYVAARASTPWW